MENIKNFLNDNMENIKKFFNYYQPFEFLFPFPNAFISEIIMLKNYDELDARTACINFGGHDANNILEMIESYHAKEYKRKDEIEDKAKSSLFVITLSLTFILSSLTFIYNNNWVIPHVIILTSLIIGVVFLILSGITAIKSLVITGYSDIYLDGRLTGDYENLQVINRSKEEEINILYECVKLNEISTNIKENYMFATITGIRNGIIFITLFFILAALNYLIK